jgi:membrane-bound lytic murein transglycosylase MltF
MYQESKMNPNAVNVNNNNTKDEGLCQLNNQYSKTFASRAGIYNFDPFNIKHNIKTAIVHLADLREYWIEQDYTSEEDLWYAILNSYNLGVTGYTDYMINTGKNSRPYDQKILEYKSMLETEGKFTK